MQLSAPGPALSNPGPWLGTSEAAGRQWAQLGPGAHSPLCQSIVQASVPEDPECLSLGPPPEADKGGGLNMALGSGRVIAETGWGPVTGDSDRNPINFQLCSLGIFRELTCLTVFPQFQLRLPPQTCHALSESRPHPSESEFWGLY